MDFDLRHVENSDFLIVNGDHLDTSTGTQIEIFHAWKHGIPVYLFGEYQNPHPWVQRCITRTEPTMADVVMYIEEFYCE